MSMKPGRPIGKRSNPDYKQYTVILRITTHDRAVEKLRGTQRDFGDYVQDLIAADLRRTESQEASGIDQRIERLTHLVEVLATLLKDNQKRMDGLLLGIERLERENYQ